MDGRTDSIPQINRNSSVVAAAANPGYKVAVVDGTVNGVASAYFDKGSNVTVTSKTKPADGTSGWQGQTAEVLGNIRYQTRTTYAYKNGASKTLTNLQGPQTVTMGYTSSSTQINKQRYSATYYGLIDRDYQTFMDRSPDDAGAAWWWNTVSTSGTTDYGVGGVVCANKIAVLAFGSLMTTSEYYDRHGLRNNDTVRKETIRRIARFCLNREIGDSDLNWCLTTYYGTDPGPNNWYHDPNSGHSLPQYTAELKIINAIATSQECINYMANNYRYIASEDRFDYTSTAKAWVGI